MGSARHKLNGAYFKGSLLFAALFGWVAESWTVFWIALAVTLGCCLYSGEIRPTSSRR
jgi:hypothetical protein